MLGETLEKRMERKEVATQRISTGPVAVPAEIREKMLYPAEQYVAIATGFGVGSLKFDFHRQLSNIIFDHLFPGHENAGEDWRSMQIHDAMLDIVDFLDETIDLPLRELTARELKMYANKLINLLWANLDVYKKAQEVDRYA